MSCVCLVLVFKLRIVDLLFQTTSSISAANGGTQNEPRRITSSMSNTNYASMGHTGTDGMGTPSTSMPAQPSVELIFD